MALQGKYQGIDIQSGTDAEVAAQMATIDAQAANAKTVTTTPTGQTSFTTGTPPPISTTQTPVAPINIPPPPEDTTFDESANFTQQFLDEYKQQQKDISDLKSERTTAREDYSSIIEKLAGQPAREVELAQEQRIPELEKQGNEIVGIIRGLQSQAQTFIDQQENRLAPSFAIVGAQARARSQVATETNKWAAALDAINGKMASAQVNIDRAIKAEFEPLEKRAEYQRFIIDQISDDLTDAQQERLNTMTILLDERSRVLDEQKANKTQVYNSVIAAIEQAGKAGQTIPNTIIQQAYRSSPEEAIALLSPYIGAQEAQTKFQFVSGTDNQPGGVFDPSTGTFTPTGGGPGPGPVSFEGLTVEQKNDPFVQLLLSTKGGKPITDTFAQSLNKGLNVLGQIGILQANIKDTDTGPIQGAFRGLNPWDTNAQTIKAQLNAIIPNLARGVYGEVGVLTDNDIAQYSKTLPNLKSTEDIRNAVLGITVDLIGKSIKRTLEINAANQKDVSGFVDIYTEMIATRDSIFSQIPGYKGAGAKSLQSLGISKGEEDIFDSVAGSTAATTDSGGGFFSNIWKGLFGN